MNSRAPLLLLLGAGLAGAAGVALAALAAHKVQDPMLASAAGLLTMHAAAVAAIAAIAQRIEHAGGFIAAGVMLLFGSIVFAGTIALLVLAGERLFPMAAPTGGSAMILGWLVVAFTALARLLRSGRP
jgi:uncharacterized membrane protein YgdD (TMEM256/DUF423 family)